MHFKDNYQPSTHQNIANELLCTYIDILWFNILDQFSVRFSLFFHSLLLLCNVHANVSSSVTGLFGYAKDGSQIILAELFCLPLLVKWFS